MVVHLKKKTTFEWALFVLHFVVYLEIPIGGFHSISDTKVEPICVLQSTFLVNHVFLSKYFSTVKNLSCNGKVQWMLKLSLCFHKLQSTLYTVQ